MPLLRPGGAAARLTLADRALHLAAFSAQRASGWSFQRKVSCFAALTTGNILLGASLYRWATGEDW